MRQLAFFCLSIFFLTACKKEDKTFYGYVDAQLVYLSADFGGRLTDLAVEKGQSVKALQFLFRLEEVGERFQVEKSQLTSNDLLAQKAQVLAQLQYNEINYRRTRDMRKQNAASQNDLDGAVRDLRISKEKLIDIEMKIKNSAVDTKDKEWQMSRKENSAPEDGLVFDTYYSKGEYVQAGYPILSLVTPNHIKAIFFVPEEKLSQLRLQAKLRLSTDKDAHFAEGRLTYISNIAEYTPPIIYSREERQKLVYRVEAKIDSPNFSKIHLGQPVTLEIIE